MSEDPIAVLERELVHAARRLSAVRDERMGSHEPRGPWPVAPRPARRRSSLGALTAMALSGLAVAVVLGALVALHGRAGAPSHSPAAQPSSQKPLINMLGVLRRPQTAADLPQAILTELSGSALPPRMRPDLALVRYAATAPWGERLYLVPMKSRPATLAVFSSGGGGAGAGDARSIESGQGIGTSGGAGIRGTRVTVVVPDGVARVKLVLPRQPDPRQYGAPVYPRSLAVSAPVHDNVAAVQVDRNVFPAALPMVWYGADGHVIKQVGNLAAANRVVATPQPGPETPLSRAAERDPATPNRVWVTPAVGGPHTTFEVHFRVLLNNAEYGYALSGTKCPAITLNGGDGGGTQDLRGRIWSDQVGAVHGQAWCPGTYHLSVSIAGTGRGRVATPAQRAFGTATFTVKP